ncbi:hypothetical protein PSTT_05139 [Puccinia striiformis]|uniref:Uncharacterized protein n=1 Tax=Puccinia striiformis TaxID=27350 RepID=A0A2S4VQA6_9BASI|nr:hypothetical protein PSTT_05139 [Puccinia striiformis]
MEQTITPGEAQMKISVTAYKAHINVPDRPNLPDFLFHFTRLTQSMLIWIGTVSSDNSGSHQLSAEMLAWLKIGLVRFRLPQLSSSFRLYHGVFRLHWALNRTSSCRFFDNHRHHHLILSVFSGIVNSIKFIKTRRRLQSSFGTENSSKIQNSSLCFNRSSCSILGSDSHIKFELEKQLFAHIHTLLSTKT